MTVGQAYSDVLTQREQRALQIACDMLIDEVFEDLKNIENTEDIVDTVLGDCLPPRYLYKYTPLFLKQFVVCIITVAWKLAQPEHKPLSSIAEELAAWAIVEKAQGVIEMEEDTGIEMDSEIKEAEVEAVAGIDGEVEMEDEDTETDEDMEREGVDEPFEAFIATYFEDTDFEFLFDDAYDGIDKAPMVAEMMGMTSLSFDDWFKPFSNEPERIAHPYVV